MKALPPIRSVKAVDPAALCRVVSKLQRPQPAPAEELTEAAPAPTAAPQTLAQLRQHYPAKPAPARASISDDEMPAHLRSVVVEDARPQRSTVADNSLASSGAAMFSRMFKKR